MRFENNNVARVRLLLAVAFCGVAMPQKQPSLPRHFEEASIKPNSTADQRLFYNISNVQSAGPGWHLPDLFDIGAKPDGTVSYERFPHKVHTQLGSAAARIFTADGRMNQVVIEQLDTAAIFTHMHSVRCMWVRLTTPHLNVPLLLNRARCTPEQARAGLAQSAARCAGDAR